jgi:hypothetical protein
LLGALVISTVNPPGHPQHLFELDKPLLGVEVGIVKTKSIRHRMLRAHMGFGLRLTAL